MSQVAETCDIVLFFVSYFRIFSAVTTKSVVTEETTSAAGFA
jgi:hypothetical protein